LEVGAFIARGDNDQHVLVIPYKPVEVQALLVVRPGFAAPPAVGVDARALIVRRLQQLAKMIRNTEQTAGRRLSTDLKQPEEKALQVPIHGLLDGLKNQHGAGGNTLNGIEAECYGPGAVSQDAPADMGSVA
jgi:hypothetical protein